MDKRGSNWDNNGKQCLENKQELGFASLGQDGNLVQWKFLGTNEG